MGDVQKSNKKWLKKTMIIGAIFGMGLLSIFVWNYGRNHYLWGDSNRELELVNDPMMAQNLAGMTLVRSDRPEPEGFSIESAPIQVTNWYKADGNLDEQLRVIAEKAVSLGWKGFDPNYDTIYDGGTSIIDLTKHSGGFNEQGSWLGAKNYHSKVRVETWLRVGVDGGVAWSRKSDIPAQANVFVQIY
jgi:hypothetical protein